MAQPNTMKQTYVQGLLGGVAAGQVVGTFARLGLADQFNGSGGVTLDDLARRLGADPETLGRFMRASTALKIVDEVEPAVYRLAGGECLRSDAPGSLRHFAITLTSPGHWLPLSRLAEAVIEGGPQAESTLGAELFDYYRAHPEEDAAFARAMDEVTKPVVTEVLDRLDWSGTRRVIDVGGSRGTLLAGVLNGRPDLAGVLFDRPEVIDGARAQLADRGVLDRCELIGGDFFTEVPTGGDVYLLKTVLHDWSDDRCRTILARCAEALGPEARLVIIELILPEVRPARKDLLADLTVLAVAGGRERTLAHYTELCAAGGLRVDEAVPLPTAGMSMIVARAI